MFSNNEGNKEFLRFMLVIHNEMSAKDLILKLESISVPYIFVSGLVNVQRYEFDLPINTHSSYEDILNDAVVRGDFKSESLQLVLSVVWSEANFMKRLQDGKVSLNLSNVVSMLKTCKKYVLKKKKVNIDIDEYVRYIERG